ncbi:hypothetical protein [Streptomyces sp. XD-27]|uniref:hypothetical protein n=1 Tax=Streptomyces sp. XD-27 TaxID=3062779 RepID=UPI0026F45932|nr:hypothetical protein [Streptomyces sp. XD-27]WKX69262.1 hypothetical protein Q3Y56_04370 [Streptomyces sp. XD-27]
MPDLLPALIVGDPVPVRAWSDFWDRLHTGDTPNAEALAVLTALSTRLPAAATLDALLRSLDERRASGPRGGEAMPAAWPGTVNMVGTGGGPPTVNLSTAAVLLAATLGVRIVKTGSRGHTSRTGSVDILERLGIPLASSYAQCEDGLGRHGIAFAGGFVYPVELTTLARRILPYGLKQVGGAVNTLGPLLARVPVAAQLTGIAEPHARTVLTGLVSRRAAAERRIWLLHNDLGVDELVSFADNVVRPHDGPPLRIGPHTLRALSPAEGTLADLAPAPDGVPPETYLRELLAGRGPRAALRSIGLNAAAAAVLSGARPDWATALAAAEDALADGAALRLVERLRADRTRRPGGARGGDRTAGAGVHG